MKAIDWKKIQAAVDKPLKWQENGSLYTTKINGLPISAFPTDMVLGDKHIFEVWDGKKNAKGSEGACVMLYGYDKDALARAVYGAHVMGGHAYKETEKGIAAVKKAWGELGASKHRAYHASLGIPDGPRIEVEADSMQRATYLIEIFEKAVKPEFKEPLPVEQKLGATVCCDGTNCGDRPKKDNSVWALDIQAFKDVTFRRKRWSLEWEYIGEGRQGDFGQVPNDIPYLRARLFWCGDEVDTYCTLASVLTPVAALKRMAQNLFRNLPTDGVYEKKIMQEWTHRTEWPTSG